MYEEARDTFLTLIIGMTLCDEELKRLCSAVAVVIIGTVKKLYRKLKNIQWNSTFQKLLAMKLL